MSDQEPNTFHILRRLVGDMECFPGWLFSLDVTDPYNGNRLVLHITIVGKDNYDKSKDWTVTHVHPVPYTTYNERSWKVWLHQQCMRTLTHELGENLVIEGKRDFAPMHGPGDDPYACYYIRSEQDALTTQDGSQRKPPV